MNLSLFICSTYFSFCTLLLVYVCLTVLRFAFLDLSAGPVEWGPIIGGEGVRSKESIPEVPIKANWRDTSIPLEEEEEEDHSHSLAADMERYRSELALLEAHRIAYCSPPLDE